MLNSNGSINTAFGELSMNKVLLYWSCQIGGWGMLFLLNLFLSSFNREIAASGYLYLGTLSILGIFISHIYRYLIIRWKLLDMNVMQQLFSVLLASIILSIITFTVHSSSIYLILGLDYIKENSTPRPSASTGTLVLAIFNYTHAYFFWSVIYFLFHYITSYNRSLKWQAISKEVELNRLKAQLNPHFIFNSLNSVRALVDEDPAKAKRSITQLSNIMRNSLIMDQRKTISFEEEMETVSDYLGLETIRYEERLHVEYDIHPESGQFDVPPMMVQTLVENGIKHGISKLINGGTLRIETNVKDDRLIIRIFNSGQYNDAETSVEGSGHGILNTKQRLNLIYDGEAIFNISNYKKGCVLTQVEIPDIR